MSGPQFPAEWFLRYAQWCESTKGEKSAAVDEAAGKIEVILGFSQVGGGNKLVVATMFPIFFFLIRMAYQFNTTMIQMAS